MLSQSLFSLNLSSYRQAIAFIMSAKNINQYAVLHKIHALKQSFHFASNITLCVNSVQKHFMTKIYKRSKHKNYHAATTQCLTHVHLKTSADECTHIATHTSEQHNCSCATTSQSFHAGGFARQMFWDIGYMCILVWNFQCWVSCPIHM